MDPDAALEHLRTLIRQLRQTTTTEAQADLGEQIADTVDDLDQWMSRGGFAPKAWRR
jgi:hypothetical protein